MKQGAFTFVLHSHLPYARMAGRWPHGEEWIHEAATETYLPLLSALHDLAAEGVRYRLTLSITPVLAEQLADADVLANLEAYLEDLHERASSDVARFERGGDRRARPSRRSTATASRGCSTSSATASAATSSAPSAGCRTRATSRSRRAPRPTATCRCSSATRRSTARCAPASARTSATSAASRSRSGCRSARTGRRTSPATAQRKPGLEEFLAAQGLLVFFVETHAILGGQPVGKAAGDAIGPYGEIPKRYTVPADGTQRAHAQDDVPAVLGGAAAGGRARPQRHHRAAGLVRRPRLPRRLRLPRVPQEGRRVRPALLARHRRRRRPRRQGALRPRRRVRHACTSTRATSPRSSRTRSARVPRRRADATASSAPRTTPSCSATGGSRASRGSRKSCATSRRATSST